MSGITGIGTTFTLPNYHGELFAVTPSDTPLLSASGGLSGGKQVDSTVFEWQSYDLRDPSIRARLEGADAPTAEERVRANVEQVTQIFQEQVATSYSKQAASGQHVNGNGGAANPVANEHTWQVMQALKQVARDINFSMWHGVKNKPADNTTARQMGGLLSSVTTNAQAKSTKITGATTATSVVTATHALSVDDKVVFTDIGDMTNVVAGRAYWVKSVSTTVSFTISATKGGAAITVGTASGVGFYPLDATDSAVGVDDVNGLLQSVFDNGGISEQGTATLFVPSGQKLAVSKAYANAYGKSDALAGSRNVGGVAVNTIVTDFGVLNVAVERALPADAIAVVSLEQIEPVFLNVPGKGVLFEEELAKTGAADKSQIYGEIGLKYGNQASHGVLRGLFA